MADLTLDQIAEIAGVEREIVRLQALIEAQRVYRKQLYADQGIDDDGTQVVEITVTGKPAPPKPEPVDPVDPVVVEDAKP